MTGYNIRSSGNLKGNWVEKKRIGENKIMKKERSCRIWGVTSGFEITVVVAFPKMEGAFAFPTFFFVFAI